MMNTSGNYEKLLEDNLKEELAWLEEEFNFLFKSKKDKYTKDDYKMGSMILDNVIDNIKTNNSEELLNLLAITLNSLEHKFPEFFWILLIKFNLLLTKVIFTLIKKDYFKNEAHILKEILRVHY